jgi:hypothetical protein
MTEFLKKLEVNLTALLRLILVAGLAAIMLLMVVDLEPKQKVVPLAHADTLVVPNKTYSPGDTIRSSEWNANFLAIEAVVNTNLDDLNLKNDGITASDKIKDGTIDLPAMGTNSVNSANIVDDSIGSGDIGPGAVTTNEILDDTIDWADLDYDGTETDEDLLAYDNGTGRLKIRSMRSTCWGVIGGHSIPGTTLTGSQDWCAWGDLADASDAGGYCGATIGQDLRLHSFEVSCRDANTGTRTFTVLKNGVSAGISCVMTATGSASFCDDATGANVLANQRISFESTGTGGGFVDCNWVVCTAPGQY